MPIIKLFTNKTLWQFPSKTTLLNTNNHESQSVEGKWTICSDNSLIPFPYAGHQPAHTFHSWTTSNCLILPKLLHYNSFVTHILANPQGMGLDRTVATRFHSLYTGLHTCILKEVRDHSGSVWACKFIATTLAELRQLLVLELNAIPQQRVCRLVSSMRRRYQAVITAYGLSTRCNSFWPAFMVLVLIKWS